MIKALLLLRHAHHNVSAFSLFLQLKALNQGPYYFGVQSDPSITAYLTTYGWRYLLLILNVRETLLKFILGQAIDCLCAKLAFNVYRY